MSRVKEKASRKIYKKHLTIIITLIIIVVMSIILLVFLNINNNYEEGVLINILGRQRMLTQIIAKDANLIYELNSSIESFKHDEKERKNLENELNKTSKQLKQYREEYETQFENIKNGYIIENNNKISFKNTLSTLNPLITKHEEIWINFNNSINIVLDEKNNTLKLFNALKYINENNELLLGYSNDITKIVLEYNKSRSLTIIHITILLIVFILICLTSFLINAYKNLFMPINKLYEDINKAGLATLDDEIPKTKNKEFLQIYAETKVIFSKLNSLITLIENLNKNIPFKDILQYIFDIFIEYIPYTYIGIAMTNKEGKTIKASYGISNKFHKNLPKRLLGFETSIKETSLYKIVQTGDERIINDLEEYVKGKPMKEYNKILLEEGIRSSITFPLKNEKEVVGIIFFSSNTKNIYKEEHIKFLKTLANSIMVSIEKDILLEDMIVSSTLALAMLTEERDPETGDHLNRMKIYSKKIAELLSYEKEYRDIIDINFINSIERFSPLHDIGKVAIRDDILLKPGKLSKDEFEIMKTHAVYGARVLKIADENVKRRGRSVFKMGIEIVEGHHEKWDGSGYPYGKRMEQIPLSARIVAIADVFDALTSKRAYKEAFSFNDSIKIIREGSGRHFDPFIVDVFVKNVEVIRKTYCKFYKN